MSLEYKSFSNISLDDRFFDSLKSDYSEFSDWFCRKSSQGEYAYVSYNDDDEIDGFLYLKEEFEEIIDVSPPLPFARRLKVGTFKIDSRGTRLGERYVKKIFDFAIENSFHEIYVTIFDKHNKLIEILSKYGFKRIGKKTTENGIENVLLKEIGITGNNSVFDYPVLNFRENTPFLLPIYPKFHTRLFPDSILKNENINIIHDVSYTNSIHKIYLTAMQGAQKLKSGDMLLIYRTSDGMSSARYRSVVTSVCVVEEVKNINEFNCFQDFYEYCKQYSVFTNRELSEFYQRKNYPFIIKFTYNVALKKRITRGELIDNFGLPEERRIGVDRISKNTMLRIILEGGVNEGIVVN